MDSPTQIQASRPHIPEYGIPHSETGMLPWSHVQQRMGAAMHYWVAVTSPEGAPHVTPLWGLWLDDLFYFDGSPRTRRNRYLATNPAVAVHLENGSDVVILEGKAHEIKIPPLELRQRLSAAYTEKYKPMGYAPGPETWESGGLYRMQPSLAFAWTKFPDDTTRWRIQMDSVGME